VELEIGWSKTPEVGQPTELSEVEQSTKLEVGWWTTMEAEQSTDLELGQSIDWMVQADVCVVEGQDKLEVEDDNFLWQHLSKIIIFLKIFSSQDISLLDGTQTKNII
jgi:hypothetical protein